MSTATKSSSSDAHRYVDYDEFIDFQVQKTRAGIKSNDLLTALIGAAVAVLAYVLVFAIFDHWVIEGGFSRGTRIILLSILLAGLSGWFVWKLAIPYFRRVSTLFAAREIEQTEPAFRSTLLTLVDLKRSGRTVSPEIRAVLEKRAGLGLTHMNIEQAVDRRMLMRLSYILLGLVVGTCLYTVLSPKQLSNSLWRSLLPTAAVAVDTRTQIDRVEPGDVDVLARAQLPVTAELSGVLPEEVTLLYSTADRSLVDEPITMRETDDGIRQYRGIITGENGRGILQSLTYRIVAGDATSDTYSVTVSQPPSANVEEVEYEYPRYMGFRDRVQIGGGIDAWEGTWVTVRATANMPVKSALVKFSDTDDITQKAEELPVEIENGTLLTARWQLRIRPDGTYPNFYRLQCRNEAGKTDPSPALHPIKIRPDQAPQVQLAKPTSDLERPVNAVVPLLYAAQDPDFLLRTVTLRFEKNGESLLQSPRLYESPPSRKAVADTYDLELSQLDLQPGDKLTYWLEARDNMEPFADRSGNSANTPKLNIKITEPVSDEQVQQQREEDQQELEEQLDELRKECEVGSEASGEQPADSSASEPDPDSSAEEEAPGESNEPADGEPADGDQSSGDQSSGGEQQGAQSQQGGKASQQQQTQDGTETGEGTQGQGEQGQQQGDSSQSGEQGDEDVPFDDLLKRLMEKEQQQGEQGGDKDQQGDQQPQQPNDPSQNGDRPPSADRQESAGEQKQSEQPQESGETGQPSGTEDSQRSSSNNREGNQGSDSASSPTNGESPPSAGEATQPTQPSDSSSTPPRPGEGTDPSSQSTNPEVREGGTEGGQPSQDNVDAPEGSKNQSETPNREDARREPADGSESGDPMTSRKDEATNPQNRKPAPAGTDSPPNPNTDPSSPQGSEKPPGAQTPPGQPNGSDQSSSSSGDSSSQSQSGEPSGSPSASEGQPGDGQKQPGDAQKSQGQPGQTGQQGGQPSESANTPQEGSKPTAPDDPAGTGEETPSTPEDAEPQGEQPGESQPQEAQSQGGEQSPPMENESSSGGKSQGGGQSPSAEQSSQPPGGEQSPQEGQPPGESSESGGQQDGGKPDDGGQQPSGGQSESGGKEPGEGGGAQPGGGQPPSGGQQPSGSQPGGSQPGQGAQQNGSSSAKEGGGSAASGDQGPPQGPPNGGNGNGDQAAPGDGAGDGETADNIQADDPDLEAKRKAANLVLKQLEDQLQRGEIDPELKEDLGVTDDQLRDFTDRLRQRLGDLGEDTSPEADARRRQFEETLRNFEFDSTGTERAGGDGPRQATGGFAGRERTAPLSRRDATREYREILNRKRQSPN